MITRRGFFGLIAGIVAAPRVKSFFGGLIPGHNYQAPTREFLGVIHPSYADKFDLPTELAKTKMCQPLPEASKKVVQFFTHNISQPIPPHAGEVKCVIGQYADYYIEHDGMVEHGPGCLERMQRRIDALPDGDDPRKMELKA